ncbi:MAG: hypothetical protein HRT47_12380 [Candidatus Caenarcaniphilales bacterium]|nr:hypothetical protein [Candidatus Caenarcaniphilales bacterium]
MNRLNFRDALTRYGGIEHDGSKYKLQVPSRVVSSYIDFIGNNINLIHKKIEAIQREKPKIGSKPKKPSIYILIPNKASFYLGKTYLQTYKQVTELNEKNKLLKKPRQDFIEVQKRIQQAKEYPDNEYFKDDLDEKYKVIGKKYQEPNKILAEPVINSINDSILDLGIYLDKVIQLETQNSDTKLSELELNKIGDELKYSIIINNMDYNGAEAIKDFIKDIDNITTQHDPQYMTKYKLAIKEHSYEMLLESRVFTNKSSPAVSIREQILTEATQKYINKKLKENKIAQEFRPEDITRQCLNNEQQIYEELNGLDSLKKAEQSTREELQQEEVALKH